MSAVSSVTIANRALQRLGATRISSLDQNHPNARSINAMYDTTRRRLLRLYAWGFSKMRASMAADATQTVYGELNRYPLPNNFVRLIRDPGPSPSIAGRHDWEIENGFIVTSDGSPLQFRYCGDVTNEGLFDPLFAEAFACTMAYEACEEITGSNEKRQLLAKDLAKIIKEARFSNAIERDASVPVEDDWITAMQFDTGAAF